MSDRVNLAAPTSPIYLPDVRSILYKLGPDRLTQLVNWNTTARKIIYWIDGIDQGAGITLLILPG